MFALNPSTTEFKAGANQLYYLEAVVEGTSRVRRRKLLMVFFGGKEDGVGRERLKEKEREMLRVSHCPPGTLTIESGTATAAIFVFVTPNVYSILVL